MPMIWRFYPPPPLLKISGGITNISRSVASVSLESEYICQCSCLKHCYMFHWKFKTSRYLEHLVSLSLFYLSSIGSLQILCFRKMSYFRKFSIRWGKNVSTMLFLKFTIYVTFCITNRFFFYIFWLSPSFENSETTISFYF